MRIRSFLGKYYSAYVARNVAKWKSNPIDAQKKIFRELIEKARDTLFGREHNFSSIRNYDDFKKQVPIRDYEGIKPYIEKIISGERDVLWRGKPIYFAKTSGTTSGVKYIPITSDSIGNHFYSAQTALMHYINETGNSAFMDGKMIFLSGSPELEKVGDINTGRLSGIVNHHIPVWLRTNQMPHYETNCIED